MRKKRIQQIIDQVESRYGPISLYHSKPTEKYGTCFTLDGIEASFSIFRNRKKVDKGTFNIQIESQPPVYYLYYNERFPLDEFIEIIETYKHPIEEWPTM